MNEDKNEIDADSPEPPTVDQMTDWQVRFRQEFLKAARARELEGEIIIVIGACMGDPDETPLNQRLPTRDGDNILYRGTISPGEQFPDPRGGDAWHVLRNDVIELWEGQKNTLFDGLFLCANVIRLVRLVRTDPNIEGSSLPTAPEKLQVEPLEPAFARLVVTFGPCADVAEYLMSLACAWGSWGPIPWSECMEGVDDAKKLATIEILHELEKYGLVRIELRNNRGYAIHLQECFIAGLLPPPPGVRRSSG